MKVLVLTTNRADYFKLENIIEFLYKSKKYELYLIVSGCHLLSDYGNTWKNIRYPIHKKINTKNKCRFQQFSHQAKISEKYCLENNKMLVHIF